MPDCTATGSTTTWMAKSRPCGASGRCSGERARADAGPLSGGGTPLMRRRLFKLAAAISLALWLLTAGLWFRSLIIWDTVHIQLPERAIDIDHAAGRLRLSTIRHVPEYPIYRDRL